jgi:hypothetical protein
MNDDEASKAYLESWNELAEMINALPLEDRRRFRKTIGKFMHDMRHTLGLIINSQDLLRRDIKDRAMITDPISLLNIIKMAGMRGNALLGELVEEFANQIDVEGMYLDETGPVKVEEPKDT